MYNTLSHSTGEKIAYRRYEAGPIEFLYLGGFASDMQGTKALFIEEWCKKNNFSFTCFDYRGHGLSEGQFDHYTLSDWLEDTKLILTHLIKKPVILIGSSMGGWIAHLSILYHIADIKGMIGIASAPDFTEKLMWGQASEAMKKEIQEKGYITFFPHKESDFHYIITQKLIEDGRRHLIFDKKITFKHPVIYLHGMQDKEVPYTFSLNLAKNMLSEKVSVRLLKNSFHRFSDEQALNMLKASILELGNGSGGGI